MHKEVRALIAQLESVPGVAVDTRPNHPRVTKDGKFVTALPTTPSKPSWYQNALAALKRGGIDLSRANVKPEREKTTLEPLPTSIPTIPETSFPVPAEMSKPKRRHTGGIPTLSDNEANILREELNGFLKKRNMTKVSFARAVVAYGKKHNMKTFATNPAAEVSIGNFLNGKQGLSLWGSEVIAATIVALRKDEVLHVQVRRPKRKTVKKQVQKASAVVETPLVVPVVLDPKPTAIENGTFDLFLSLIENRALSKTELMNALTLAEMQTEFEHAHPRS